MSGGAFRDAGALLERVAALQARNEELEAELRAGGTTGGEGEIARLRAELKDALTKLAAMTRDLAAVEANFRALRNTAASDEGVELREENARLRDARDNANRVIADLESSAEEAARWHQEAQRLETVLVSARKEAARWHQEAQRLETVLVSARKELAAVQAQVSVAKHQPDVVTKVPENLQAFMKRLQEERDELASEVRDLTAKLKNEEPKTFLSGFFRPR